MDWAPELGFTGQKLLYSSYFLSLLYILKPLKNFKF